jgi:hypothetical protein
MREQDKWGWLPEQVVHYAHAERVSWPVVHCDSLMQDFLSRMQSTAHMCSDREDTTRNTLNQRCSHVGAYLGMTSNASRAMAHL